MADVVTFLGNVSTKLGQIVTVSAGAATSLGSFTIAVNNNTKALDANATSLGKIADAQAKVDAAKMQEAIDKETAAWDKESAAIDKAAAKMNAFKNSADGATDTMESLGKGMSNTDGSMVTTTTNLSLMTGAWLTVTAATDAQTASLKALLQTQNAYSDSVANALTVGKGWNDYLAGLADQYKTGAIDILQYKNALTDFSTQLSQDFSGATGKARDAITSLQRAIQSLINSAGGGPSTPTGAWQSPTTQLNQAFNGP
jgi:hypothetical protein